MCVCVLMNGHSLQNGHSLHYHKVPHSSHQGTGCKRESQHASMTLKLSPRAGGCAGGAWSHLEEAEGHPREHSQPPPNSLYTGKQRSAGVE